MKEKFIMTSFFVAGLSDIATTAIGLENGMVERGIAGKNLAETNNMVGAYVFRIAVTSVLIGLYAFSKENPSRFSFSIDRATRIANVICWGVVALNATQLAMINR
jgi:energy-converting hydrogenase Eha subunit A